MATLSVNVLFTSVGRRVELIRAFKNAYETLKIGGKIVATDTDNLAPALHIVDQAYIVPPFNSADYLPTLLEICRRENITLIFPLIDPDIPMLAKHRVLFKDIGTCPVVLSTDSVTICEDKWRTYQFFRDKSILTPKSWLPEHLGQDELEFPLFLKPRKGSGSKNTYKANNEKELAFFLKYIERPIVQEFIPGTEVTNDIFCDLEGNIIEVVLRQRIDTRGGEVSKGVTIENPDITDGCINIAKSLSTIGPICVQCILKDNQPYFTEVNARFGGGAPLSFAAGANMPLWILAESADIPISLPKLSSYQAGLYLSRFDDSLFLREKDRDEVGGNCI